MTEEIVIIEEFRELSEEMKRIDEEHDESFGLGESFGNMVDGLEELWDIQDKRMEVASGIAKTVIALEKDDDIEFDAESNENVKLLCKTCIELIDSIPERARIDGVDDIDLDVKQYEKRS